MTQNYTAERGFESGFGKREKTGGKRGQNEGQKEAKATDFQ